MKGETWQPGRFLSIGESLGNRITWLVVLVSDKLIHVCLNCERVIKPFKFFFNFKIFYFFFLWFFFFHLFLLVGG